MLFAGGQILNSKVISGRISAKQRHKDSSTLAKLGVQHQQRSSTATQRDKPNHKYLFFEKDEKSKEKISKLSQTEMCAVRKVACK